MKTGLEYAPAGLLKGRVLWSDSLFIKSLMLITIRIPAPINFNGDSNWIINEEIWVIPVRAIKQKMMSRREDVNPTKSP